MNKLIIAALMVVLITPAATAQSHSAGHQQDLYTKTVLKVAGTVEAGEFHSYLTYPYSVSTVGSTFRLTANFAGPLITGVGGSIVIGSPTDTVGCSVGTGSSGSSATSLTGAWAYAGWPVTLTSRTCTGSVPVTVSTVLGTLWTGRMSFTVNALDTTQNVNNNVSGTLDVNALVDVLTIPDLHVYVEAWPQLFASTEITDWGDLVAALNALASATAANDFNVTIAHAFENATVEASPDENEIQQTIELWWPLLLAFLFMFLENRSKSYGESLAWTISAFVCLVLAAAFPPAAISEIRIFVIALVAYPAHRAWELYSDYKEDTELEI